MNAEYKKKRVKITQNGEQQNRFYENYNYAHYRPVKIQSKLTKNGIQKRSQNHSKWTKQDRFYKMRPEGLEPKVKNVKLKNYAKRTYRTMPTKIRQ